MRKDINKVVYDGRSYSHSEGRNKNTAKKLNLKDLRNEDQNSVSHVSLGKRRHYHGGWTYNKPIEGFLRKSVGRSWNKVHSEFCEHLDIRTLTGYDLRKSMDRNVHLNAYWGEDKRLYIPSRWYGWGPTEASNNDYYVDPTNGTLRQYKRKEATEKEHRQWMVNHISWLTLNDNVHYNWVIQNVPVKGGKRWETTRVEGWERVTFRRVVNDEYKESYTWDRVTETKIYNDPILVHRAGEWVYSGADPKPAPKFLKEADELLREEIAYILKTGKRNRSASNGFSKAFGVYDRENRMYRH